MFTKAHTQLLAPGVQVLDLMMRIHPMSSAAALLCLLASCSAEIGPPERDPGTDRTITLGATEITAVPRVVPVAEGKLGSTTVSWRRAGQAAWIYVSKDQGARTLFAASSQGSAEAPWIAAGSSYTFSMHPSKDPTTPALSTVTVTTAQRAYSEFAPYGGRHAGQIAAAGSSSAYSQWASNPLGNDRVDVSWGSPDNWTCTGGTKGCPTVEEHGIRRGCSHHGDWVWIYAYRDDWTGNRYRIRTTRALLIVGGQTSDITGQCGTEGQPYALHRLGSQPYVLKVWGDILDSSGKLGRRFYWQHRISPPRQVSNPCWTGAQPTRLALRQDELWWDSVLGWSIGGGGMGAAGEPDGTGTWYGRYQTMAEHTGYAWTLGTRTSESQSWSSSCMVSRWSW